MMTIMNVLATLARYLRRVLADEMESIDRYYEQFA